MKTVTLCGSMRFEQDMREIALELESKRRMNVLQCTYSIPGRRLSETEKHAIIRAHYRKIDLSDAIYIVDIGGYIGESVTQEIAYAREKGKEILFHSRMEK